MNDEAVRSLPCHLIAEPMLYVANTQVMIGALTMHHQEQPRQKFDLLGGWHQHDN